MLANELHTSHSNKLEWIVIILILIEVFFQEREIVPNLRVEEFLQQLLVFSS